MGCAAPESTLFALRCAAANARAEDINNILWRRHMYLFDGMRLNSTAPRTRAV